MGLDLPSGGHLTHGYYNDKKKVRGVAVVGRDLAVVFLSSEMQVLFGTHFVFLDTFLFWAIAKIRMSAVEISRESRVV